MQVQRIIAQLIWFEYHPRASKNRHTLSAYVKVTEYEYCCNIPQNEVAWP